MIRVRKREKLAPIVLCPGDMIVVTHTDEDGTKRELVRDTFDRSLVVNEAVIFDVSEELGFEDGIGGAVGKAKDETRSNIVKRDAVEAR